MSYLPGKFITRTLNYVLAFPGGLAGKEFPCNVGDLGSIPRLGRSPGEGKGYTLQYSWASLLAQLAKNPPAMWETWVQSLSWEDPLEKGKATHSSIGPGELQRVWQDWAAFTFTFGYVYILNPWLTAKDIVLLNKFAYCLY